MPSLRHRQNSRPIATTVPAELAERWPLAGIDRPNMAHAPHRVQRQRPQERATTRLRDIACPINQVAKARTNPLPSCSPG
jgi:hypothetical protein